MSEIVCFPVLIFTYSHVENSLFFALDWLFLYCFLACRERIESYYRKYTTLEPYSNR